MGPKAALRRVGMVYEIPHPQLNVLSKQLPDEGSLETMLEDLPDLQRFAENHPDVWRHACAHAGRERLASQSTPPA
jgi:DNA polymerase III alpha subunit